jgi:BirA family biotin operon repressor/biotin-[acetyl-CoA-carboxylase] ligase
VPLPAGFRLVCLPSVASTNDELRRRAEAGAAPGLVVVAEEQTEGRGRYGRRWTSPPGNLHASVLLRQDRPLAEIAQLSLVAGLALVDALAAHAPGLLDARLKWPNDLLIGGAKVAGILLESGGPDPRRPWVIVGSGVNVASAPVDTPYPATSLLREGFAGLAPLDLLASYLQALSAWLDRWQDQGFAGIRTAWRARAFGLGGMIRLRLEREEVYGRFVDLGAGGALLIEEADGRRREITAGEIFYLGE